MSRNSQLLFADLFASAKQWRFWLSLGWNDIAKQYRRSFLGPIWIAVNTGIFVVAFGLIGAQLFKIDVKTYLPYFAIGHIVFGFFSSVMLEASQTFLQAEGYLKHAASPKLIHVFRAVTRNFLTLGHNFLIVLGVLAWAGALGVVQLVPFIASVVLCGVAAFLVTGILAAICARFRDVPMIISSAMQVLFFLTPVMWRPDQLTDRAQWLVHLNPFALFLDLTRAPLLGVSPSVDLYGRALAIIVALVMLFAAVMAWARRRIVYWL